MFRAVKTSLVKEEHVEVWYAARRFIDTVLETYVSLPDTPKCLDVTIVILR